MNIPLYALLYALAYAVIAFVVTSAFAYIGKVDRTDVRDIIWAGVFWPLAVPLGIVFLLLSASENYFIWLGGTHKRTIQRDQGSGT